MTPEREQKIRETASKRQVNLTVVLENVHDPHNVGAILRTCDAVGIPEVFVLYTEPQLTPARLRLGKRSSAGARDWVEVRLFTDVVTCFRELKSRYVTVLGACPASDAAGLYHLDLTRSTALVFGNEHDGLSAEVLALLDGTFSIPQAGMVESLNVSVACGVTLFEAYRQRLACGYYQIGAPTEFQAERDRLLVQYLQQLSP